ncbi:hypothetical protein SAMN04487897_12447 [Paenibacillus sp. yr247]|uniref:hypothetical protein n=1 Tax=Paenibacillus sp. yr247 TaxID=1761880 RepID=UPI000888FE85|nr:hypothetical protein [Paenibacillus sp. yr247]SDO84895.1 hypothetical protein SAMN04487897_12447 [Paenibacillus sp. yr247]
MRIEGKNTCTDCSKDVFELTENYGTAMEPIHRLLSLAVHFAPKGQNSDKEATII